MSLLSSESDHHGLADDHPANFGSWPPKSTPPEKRKHQWAITLIRQHGKLLSYVKALDAETAIQEAIEHFEITDPEQQKRLIAQRSDWPRCAGSRSSTSGDNLQPRNRAPRIPLPVTSLPLAGHQTGLCNLGRCGAKS
jgi:hypothetical protein